MSCNPVLNTADYTFVHGSRSITLLGTFDNTIKADLVRVYNITDEQLYFELEGVDGILDVTNGVITFKDDYPELRTGHLLYIELAGCGIGDGVVDDDNSSIIPLGIGGVFTGTASDILAYGIIFISVFTDVPCATDGLSIQQSSDGINWDHSDDYSIPANKGKNYSINPYCNYLRIVYTNGADAQSVFRLQTILKPNSKPSSHKVQDDIVDDDDSELVTSVVKVQNPDGITYSNVNTINPLPTSSQLGVPSDYTKQTSNAKTYSIQKGQLNHYRLRPQIVNEHVETAREIQSTVTAINIVGQVFKHNQDNINGITFTGESAAGIAFDDFESYADDAALQLVWVESGTTVAILDTLITYEGTQSMEIDTDSDVNDEWERTFATTDFSNYTGQFQMYCTKEYKDVQMRVFVRDSIGNTNSANIITVDKNIWYKYIVDTASLIADGGTAALTTDIVGIGFRLQKKRGGQMYIDDMVSVPNPGLLGARLYDFGTTLPTTEALDDATQCMELGDKGINGGGIVSEVEVSLLGGKRQYTVNNFVTGVALEIPSNILLTIGNYYAITFHYIDTEVNIYGANTSFVTNYYTNGFAFDTPNEATGITKLGEYNDIQFAIFSTQDVYINTMLKSYNNSLGNIAYESVYIEDSNMKIVGIIAGEHTPPQVLQVEFKDRTFILFKGGKFEVNHNDDFTDNTSQVSILVGYIYKPPIVNG